MANAPTRSARNPSGPHPRPLRPPDLGEACDTNDTAGEPDSVAAKRAFERRRIAWVEEVNRFVAALQTKSCQRPGQPAAAIKMFKPISPHELERQSAGRDRVN